MSSRKGDKWERAYRNVLTATEPEGRSSDDVYPAEVTKADADLFDTFDIRDGAFLQYYTALRVPASGSAVAFDLPDLHVWLRTTTIDDDFPDPLQFAVEVKAGRERVRFDKNDGSAGVPALRRYADRTASVPCAFIHIDYVGDFVVHVDDLHETNKAHTFTENRDVDRDAVVPFETWVDDPAVIDRQA